MIDNIGNAAGQIWAALAEADAPVNVTELPKVTKLKTPIAYQAIGWLAREGKIVYHKQGQKTCVSLAHAECMC
ncbi:winged helix-turn-helix domain-containing protein [Planctomycetota bacterium]